MFELRRSINGQFYYVFLLDGNPAFRSEEMRRKLSVQKTIASMQSNPDLLRWEYFTDAASKERFRIKGRNGRTVGHSTEGYPKEVMYPIAKRCQELIPTAEIVDKTQKP